jgi:NADH dehydrogenase [ubiquinone] 1 alpha subcomplex assembly factor 7
VLPEAHPAAQLIARQIEGSGPISVAEYMRIANGQYYGGDDPIGADGDFITAPEISQMFGELIGLWLSDIWMQRNRPNPCHYVELGPGRGTLAVDVLRTMAQFEFHPAVQFVETSDAMQTKQLAAVPNAIFHSKVDRLPSDGPLFIVANEFFDALPVRQLISTHAGWRELLVARGQGQTFITVPGTHNMDHVVPANIRNAPAGSIYETAAEASGILYEITSRLQKQGGVMLVIDYGYTQSGLGSTLQAVKDHKFANPFLNPGEHDLTAHVNFVEMASLAEMQEMRVHGPVDQGDWLVALGINQRATMLAGASPNRSDEIFAARDRLITNDQMGNLFKVMAISSADWPRGEGFGIP